MIFLSYDDLLHIAERVVGEVLVRDPGSLEAAAQRPQVQVAAADAYPTIDDKAAALMQSLARGHPLVDGNKRLSLAAVVTFYGINGRVLSLSNDAAYDLVISVATGEIDDVQALAAALKRANRKR